MSKILIIDDDQDLIEASKVLLEAKGHQVSSASNKEDGLKAIEESKPDILILDVMMEQADDGIVMAQDLKKRGFISPIIMISGIGKITGLDYDKDDVMVPVDVFLEKPIKPDLLVNKINELLKVRKD
jgi:DNA-binding NtrC family response regulator